MANNIVFNSREELMKYLDEQEAVTVDLRFEFTDSDVMWFGKYKTHKLGDIPDSYFKWLWREGYSKKCHNTDQEGKLARYISKIVTSK